MATGLDFPGSNGVAVGETMRFRFVNPQSNGLPIYGPSGVGVTYIWRCYPRQQDSYYTAFFWGNDGTFLWDSGSPNTYYGAHPYPQVPPDGATHYWEISVEGGDEVDNDVVEYDRWYTQVLRVWADGSGKHHEFYWDWPNTDEAHLITFLAATGYGETDPPSPALTWGDAPWSPSNEVWNGILRGFQIYPALLSLGDITSEIAAPASAASLWYLNLNPTPSDIGDKSGAGHDPEWVGANRPTLWTDAVLGADFGGVAQMRGLSLIRELAYLR